MASKAKQQKIIGTRRVLTIIYVWVKKMCCVFLYHALTIFMCHSDDTVIEKVPLFPNVCVLFFVSKSLCVCFIHILSGPMWLSMGFCGHIIGMPRHINHNHLSFQALNIKGRSFFLPCNNREHPIHFLQTACNFGQITWPSKKLALPCWWLFRLFRMLRKT